MERRYYDRNTIERALALYERKYGLTPVEFMEAHAMDGEQVAAVPNFHRNIWAGLCRDLERLSGDEFVSQVAKTLEPA